jgi:hypothetical protein
LSLKNQLTPDPIISHIEIYSTGKTEAKYPSKWVTEIYIPVLSKIIPVKAYTPTPKNPAITRTPQLQMQLAKIKKPVIKSTEQKKLSNPKLLKKTLQNFNLILTYS